MPGLACWDQKTVRLTTTDQEIFEGEASFSSLEYNLHEYGREEDGLLIDDWLFLESDIETIEEIPPHKIAVWKNRPQHSMRIPSALYRNLEQGTRMMETRIEGCDPDLLKEGDVLRLEDESDETEQMHFVLAGKEEGSGGLYRFYLEELK